MLLDDIKEKLPFMKKMRSIVRLRISFYWLLRGRPLEKGCSLGAGFISAGSATVILGRGARGRRPWVRGALGGGTESSGLDGATAAAS